MSQRFHVHLHVADLAKSIAFYNQLFAAQPARLESDYAKWMLDDPRINFAISTRGHAPGIDHLGLQTDNAEDLPFGVPDEMATTRVDATEFEPLKMKALAAHATQVTVDGPFFALSDHIGSRAWGYEFYRVVRGAAAAPYDDDGRETSLLNGLA